MAHKAKKKAKSTTTATRAAKKPNRAAAKAMTAKEPRNAVAASTAKQREKSVTEVAATHIEHNAFSLGYRIPSAWWRHAS